MCQQHQVTSYNEQHYFIARLQKRNTVMVKVRPADTHAAVTCIAEHSKLHVVRGRALTWGRVLLLEEFRSVIGKKGKLDVASKNEKLPPNTRSGHDKLEAATNNKKWALTREAATKNEKQALKTKSSCYH